MKGILAVLLLLGSNIFMTLAWYGHLRFGEMDGKKSPGLILIILSSWGIALFEYMLQVPANRLGFKAFGGPFNLWQLKVIQEAITLIVFLCFTLLVFKNETFRWNHAIGLIFLFLAVFFIFKKTQ
ncbi:MAG: DMT family protein [Bacteroidota bacterium]